jgi:peptide-methionine (S)-S-oxide reductase
MAKATFAEGCFWGVEANFQHTPGVTSAVSGYAGGKTENPSYEDVCSGRTGHAEAVEVEFDPQKVRYEDLLQIFWTSHDPTTPNRQGPDVGTQYRSAIFFHDAAQQAAALASKEQLGKSGRLKRPIVTEIVAAGPFYRAEGYHQKYFAKHGLHGCGI